MRLPDATRHRPPPSGWEHFPHDADIGVRGWGPTPADAFAQAAMALTRIVTAAEVRPVEPVAIACDAPDLELLLVEWLNAVIYEMAVRRVLFGRFSVEIDLAPAPRLRATIEGEPIDRARHDLAVEPKGATVTALHVGRDAVGRWTAACVIDV
jgi:tRNA nucleotidyltransferase (CCA-adding enzyme)